MPSSPSNQKSRTVLIVLDGFGIGKDSPFNAIKNARMPFFRDVLSKYPHSQLFTHGEAVGLPDGVMGNSEVGHMTMGAGRVIYQDLTRISKFIRSGEFAKNETLRGALTEAGRFGGRPHLMGLLSDAGVHSHIDHLLALLDMCGELRIPEVAVHVFTDGRDTPPDSAPIFIERLLSHPAFGSDRSRFVTQAKIVSISGRYYAMDRDQRWERVEAAFKAITGQGRTLSSSSSSKAPALRAVEASYAAQKTDEFVEPTTLAPEWKLTPQDSAIFFNYRSDRARELSAALCDPAFKGFSRPAGFPLKVFAGMTQYDINLPAQIAFKPQSQAHLLGELLEERHLKQLRIAETEKYAHVTFFFNGGREAPYQGEDRVLIPSPKDVPTYDLKPEMSAEKVASEAVARINLKQYDFILMNFANADMVGHTGNYEATVRAMETIDKCLAMVCGAANKNGYHVLITADHGNAEEMCDHDGKLHTQHTLNPVPAIWIAPHTEIAPLSARGRLNDGKLSDIMPTLLDLMGVPFPKEVDGTSLIASKGNP